MLYRCDGVTITIILNGSSALIPRRLKSKTYYTMLLVGKEVNLLYFIRRLLILSYIWRIKLLHSIYYRVDIVVNVGKKVIDLFSNGTWRLRLALGGEAKHWEARITLRRFWQNKTENEQNNIWNITELVHANKSFEHAIHKCLHNTDLHGNTLLNL